MSHSTSLAQERVEQLRRGYPRVAESLRLLGVVTTMPLLDTAVRAYSESLPMELTAGNRVILRRNIIGVAQTVKDCRAATRNPRDTKRNYHKRQQRLDRLFADIAGLLGITEDKLHEECGRWLSRRR